MKFAYPYYALGAHQFTADSLKYQRKVWRNYIKWIDQLIDIRFYRLEYDEFVNMEQAGTLDHNVIISRPDCSYCVDFMNRLSQQKCAENVMIYYLDSTNLSVEEKKVLNQEYSINSVPTVVLQNGGRIDEVVTGYMDEEVIKIIVEEEKND